MFKKTLGTITNRDKTYTILHKRLDEKSRQVFLVANEESNLEWLTLDFLDGYTIEDPSLWGANSPRQPFTSLEMALSHAEGSRLVQALVCCNGPVDKPQILFIDELYDHPAVHAATQGNGNGQVKVTFDLWSCSPREAPTYIVSPPNIGFRVHNHLDPVTSLTADVANFSFLIGSSQVGTRFLQHGIHEHSTYL